MSRFEARLPSTCPGIAFTARITATVLTGPPYPGTDDEIVGAVRGVLRKAAADVSATCHPADLASARDGVGQHLRRPRALPTEPPVDFRAEVTLDLLLDDRAAVDALLAAQREQAMADILRRQNADAVAAELANPDALLVRWVERENADWSTFSVAFGQAEQIAQRFAQYRPEHQRTIEHEALEILREFLSSFPDPAQKRMLYTLFAAGMDGAKRPQHAEKAHALLRRLTLTHPVGDE
ncbi:MULTISPECIES: hypothetical protein [unclassified Streptomyces]|uniref:hypothetical protein n=1 Tax=unclassified Streptomyces TaxID=2593676 RepID=UPI002E294BB1|nr:hypothetical protein [Streptomyces sp. NBC_00223]